MTSLAWMARQSPAETEACFMRNNLHLVLRQKLNSGKKRLKPV